MKSLKFILIALSVFIANTVPAIVPAMAQVCTPQREVILTLRESRFGVPTVWDARYRNRDYMIQMASGVPMKGGTVLAVGRKLDKKTYKPLETFLVELNRRGRVLTEKIFPAKDGELPVKMITLGDGYLVVSAIQGGKKKKRSWIRLSWYDKNADFRKEKIIKDAAYDYNVSGLVKSVDTEGFVVVAQAVSYQRDNDRYGVLIRFTPEGKMLWKRAYRPGIPNKIHDLSRTEDNGYMATGHIRLDDGRMAGWALKLSFEGAVFWQRSYPRGAFSTLRRSSQSLLKTSDGTGFLFTGETTPLDGGPDAAWLMAIDATGQPVWQRYFRRNDYAFHGIGLRAHKDGRITAVMNATVTEEAREREAEDETEDNEKRNHVRILTLSPRGVIIESESYIEGLQAKGTDFVEGWNGERIMTATIESDAIAIFDEGKEKEKNAQENAKDGTKDGAKKPPPKKEPPVQEGWIFVGTALDPYEDPCKGMNRR